MADFEDPNSADNFKWIAEWNLFNFAEKFLNQICLVPMMKNSHLPQT